MTRQNTTNSVGIPLWVQIFFEAFISQLLDLCSSNIINSIDSVLVYVFVFISLGSFF